MINYVNFNQFYNMGADIQYTITYSGGTLTNNDIYLSDGIKLEESICSSDQLRFGSCESSKLRLKVNSENLVGDSLVDETLNVSLVIGGDTANPLQIGTYKVVTDTPDRYGYYREIVAFDSLYEVLSRDFSYWYNNVVGFPCTLKQFRNSFFSYVGITQETVTLPCDDYYIQKTLNPTLLTGSTILEAICEINGRFGHIGRDGKFKYIELTPIQEGLFPANDLYPAEDLYPSEENTQSIGKRSNHRIMDMCFKAHFPGLGSRSDRALKHIPIINN